MGGGDVVGQTARGHVVRIDGRASDEELQAYLLTPMDRATLLHVKLTILHCPPSIITRQRVSVDSKLLAGFN